VRRLQQKPRTEGKPYQMGLITTRMTKVESGKEATNKLNEENSLQWTKIPRAVPGRRNGLRKSGKEMERWVACSRRPGSHPIRALNESKGEVATKKSRSRGGHQLPSGS